MRRLFPCIIAALWIAAVASADTNGIALFNGRSLTGWKEVAFWNKGTNRIAKGGILELGVGGPLTGLVYTNEPPARMNYEITLEGRRTKGMDFFCGLTFPVATNSCSLILGGWGGSLTGISSIDGSDASENQTTGSFTFEQDRWYRIRVRITAVRIQGWVDDRKIVDADIGGRNIGMRRGEIELCVPLGLATYETCGQLRNLRLRKLSQSEIPPEGP
jgi:hypothetical protein